MNIFNWLKSKPLITDIPKPDLGPYYTKSEAINLCIDIYRDISETDIYKQHKHMLRAWKIGRRLHRIRSKKGRYY